MGIYTLKVGQLERELPIVSLGPKIKVASVNLLGDTKLVEVLATEIKKKMGSMKFDYLVGPETKVLPLLHELSKLYKMDRYVVCRKRIHAYMQSPLKSAPRGGLVINGVDAELIKNKSIVIVDDVVSSGKTIYELEKLMAIAKAKVVAKVALFKQGDRLHHKQNDLIYLQELPVFDT